MRSAPNANSIAARTLEFCTCRGGVLALVGRCQGCGWFSPAPSGSVQGYRLETPLGEDLPIFPGGRYAPRIKACQEMRREVFSAWRSTGIGRTASAQGPRSPAWKVQSSDP